MSIPERRKMPRGEGGGFGQLQGGHAIDQLSGGIGNDVFLASEPNKDTKTGMGALVIDQKSVPLPREKPQRESDADGQIDQTQEPVPLPVRKPSLESPFGIDPNDPPDTPPTKFGVFYTTNIPRVFPDEKGGTVTSGRGWRTLKDGRLDYHAGIDIRKPAGAPVISAQGGTIEHVANKDGKFGVIIEADDGKIYTYWHVNPVEYTARGRKLEKGKRVKIGDLLGTIEDRKEKGSILHYACHDPDEPEEPNVRRWEGRTDFNSCDPSP